LVAGMYVAEKKYTSSTLIKIDTYEQMGMIVSDKMNCERF